MKRVITLSALAILLGVFTTQACDSSKAIAGSGSEIDLVLQPGVPQSVTWDFTDCTFGITSDSFFVTKPRNKAGNQGALPGNAPLTVTLYDATLGQFLGNGTFSFYCIEGCGNVSGHILIMTLTATGNKPLAVEISQYATWGGPP